MLQSIRDHTQGWIAGTIVSLLILSFALWGIHSYIGGGNANNTVAKVNGTEISKNQLSVAYDRLRRQFQAQPAALPIAQSEALLKEQALKSLITIEVLKQSALAHRYRIAADQVDGFLENMPEFQVEGKFSAARFQQFMQMSLFNAGEFLELIKTTLLIDQPRLGVVFTSFALPNEVSDAMALVNQEREVQYVILPAQAFNQGIQISSNQIQEYYQAHQDNYKTPEQVSIDYVVLSLKDTIANVHPTEDSLKKFYQENTNAYSTPMQWNLEAVLLPLSKNATDKVLTDAQSKANEMYQKAMNGENLSALMTKFGAEKNDKLSGWIPSTEMPAQLQKELSTIKTGQVTQPIKTDAGLLIIKMLGTKEAVVQSYAQVASKVKETYIRQQAEESFANAREKLSNLTYEHPDSLQEAAKTLGLPIKSSESFTKDKGNEIAANPKVREAAFSNDVLNLRNNSDVISLDNDTALVLRVKNHAPAAVQPLQSVEKQIAAELIAAKANTKALQTANDMQQRLNAGAKAEEVASQYHLNWKQLGFVGRHAKDVASEILNAAFALPTKSNENGKPVYGVVKMPEGYAVVSVRAMRNNESLNHDQKAFAEQLASSEGLMEYEFYKQSQIQQAKITIE